MITIMMATYNGGRYVAEQIESLLRQTEQEWEFELAGGRLAGRFRLVRQAGAEEWELRAG